MTTTQIKNRGFTLVELLIVIVIIAILTVVSLVAYNGLQNQAKTSTAKSTADSVAKKAELYNTEKGHYPEGLTIFTSDTDNSTTPPSDNKENSWYMSGESVKSATLTDGSVPADGPLAIEYVKCPGSSTSPTGAQIYYYDFSSNKKVARVVGTGC